MAHGDVIATGVAEKIGEASSLLTHKVFPRNDNCRVQSRDDKINDHRDGLEQIVDLLTDAELGVIKDKSDISAVGHRVVHGGETFKYPTIINDSVIKAIEKNTPLAPLHNPPNLTGIEVAKFIFPSSPHVAVFDTAFHQTLPRRAFLYAIPYDLYRKDRVRRYGFHGTSHSFVAESLAKHLDTPLNKLNLITIHLGNGASMAAIRGGASMDTTMGMTPLEGLVMGTRSGDLDPALPFFLADHLGMTLDEINELLNKKSGLKGICGSNDMREILERKDAKDDLSEIAVELYCYRIKKYIGAYFAVLGTIDGIIFTGGIGENSSVIRELCCHDLKGLGIEIDQLRNSGDKEGISEVSAIDSKVRIFVVPTNEELKIALETKKVIENQAV
jgi:acetate kinase